MRLITSFLLFCASFPVQANMSENPLQITISKDLFSQVLHSAGSDILKVLDKMRIPAFTNESQTVKIKNLVMSSVSSSTFKLDLNFNTDKNQLIFKVPAAAKAELRGRAELESPSGLRTVEVTAVLGDCFTMHDFNFKKQIPNRHVEYLRKLHLSTDKNEQIVFQILEH